MGFIGSHADIGGGYAEGDLSDISLNWIYHQATALGIKLRQLNQEDTVISNPVIHDKALPGSGPIPLERRWKTRSSDGNVISGPTQKNAIIGGMSYQGTIDFISYYPEIVELDPVEGARKPLPGPNKTRTGDLL